MLTQDFLIWAIVIGAIAIFGIAVMVRAYFGTGSLAVRFMELMPTSMALPTLEPAAAIAFEQGNSAFQMAQYRKASDRFRQALELDNSFAEAVHHLGLTTANLKQDGEAARLLVKAGELYLEQNNQVGYARIKQDLETLKTSYSG